MNRRNELGFCGLMLELNDASTYLEVLILIL
ncbi:Uncharacterised protein [Legionella pneumophila]|nr:Uncharacterised protein [Legionella pneumophila]CZH12972.1 Uncharacterised protein [Legionella pneumophila]